MFPGTISFKKPIERNENAQQYAQRHGALEGSHRYNQLVEKFNQKDSRFNKAEAIANYYTQLQYDVIGGQAAFSESRKHVNGNTTHIAHTAGYGMIDGQIVGKYKKVMGFNEVSRQKSGESCAFLPGKLEQPALIHRGVKHSLEICNDHVIAIMSRPENIGNIGDVHIIQSDVANENFTDELMARAKGIVHSSTFEIDPKNGQELAGVTNPSGQKINPVFRNPFVRAYTV